MSRVRRKGRDQPARPRLPGVGPGLARSPRPCDLLRSLAPTLDPPRRAGPEPPGGCAGRGFPGLVAVLRGRVQERFCPPGSQRWFVSVKAAVPRAGVAYPRPWPLGLPHSLLLEIVQSVGPREATSAPTPPPRCHRYIYGGPSWGGESPGIMEPQRGRVCYSTLRGPSSQYVAEGSICRPF